MNFIWDVQGFNVASFVVETILMVLIFALLSYSVIKTINRVRLLIIYFSTIAVCLFSYIANLNYLFYTCVFLLVIVLFLVFMVNIGDVRKFIANPFKKATSRKASPTVEKIIDRHAVYTKVESAVEALSRSRIGAIITFEKDTSLADIAKNGVPVNAPVSPELLLTIFYPGTRLHDGAVIIKDDKIVSASVFYTPTTKVFAGKYGSRHRAAIGISEISDSITVVVSEETGLISIASDGQLENISLSDLVRILTNQLSR